jgi:putative heme-binding domain-containing protein
MKESSALRHDAALPRVPSRLGIKVLAMKLPAHSIFVAVLALAGVTAAAESAAPGAPDATKPSPESTAETKPVRVQGIRARQRELDELAAQSGPEADQKLLAQFEAYRAGTLPPALWLELFEAAAKRDHPALKARLAERERELEASRDPLSRYRECLEGGDAVAGRALFIERPEAGCIRCHRVSGEGGEIGPDLTALRQATDRIFILESIIDPNAKIAFGYPNVLLKLTNGELVSGVAAFESSEEIIVTSVVDGKKRTVKTADVAERTPLPSAMPPGFGLVLGKRAIRDLVEFLATLE